MLDHQYYIEALKQFKNALPMSYTKINTLLACPLKYSRQYLEKAEKAEPPQKEVLAVGRFIHKVMEFCANRGQQFGWYEDVIDFDAVWMNTVRQMNLTQGEYCKAEALRIHAENVFIKVLAAINRHQLRVLTEMTVCMDLNGIMRTSARYLDRFFFGYIDYYAETPSGRRAIVLDYKTGQKSEEAETRTKAQLSAYIHFLFLRNTNLESVQFGGAYIPDEEIALGPQVFRDSNEHRETDAIVESLYNSYLEALKTTDFSAVPSIHCNWCNYTYSCPAR